MNNLQSRVIDHHPDLILIEFSYNDTHKKFKMPLRRGLANLDSMVTSLHRANPKISIVLQVMNIGWDAPNGKCSQSARPQLEAFNDNYRAYARAHSLPLLDHYPNWLQLKEKEPETYQSYVPDGTHPKRQGSLSVTWPVVKLWMEVQRQAAIPPSP